ncbi:MAG: radical SAM protein [Nitrospirae bacterium]|nr:radical SAM protein [Nitrospirota bacterium]
MRILLVVYDNDMYINTFPISLGYIAGILKKGGYDVEIYNQDMHHYPDEHLTAYLDQNYFDVVGVSVVAGYYQYRKLLKISDAINKSKRRPFFVMGGHGPTPDPEFFLKKTSADAIVMGEGEVTVIELMKALTDKRALSEIKGIAFRDGDKIFVNERRPLIEDINTIPFPAYELFPVDYYKLKRVPHASNADFTMDVLSGRGCTFKCNFCYRMDVGFRPRSNESIIEEIRLLKRNYNITYIVFQDELLMSSIERTIALCEDFINAKLNIKWNCQGRLNYAKPEVLSLMKKAGCVFINYGIEAMDDNVLKNMKKGLVTKQIVAGIENTIEAGVSPGFNIIFGNIGDSRESLNKGVEFLLKYDDGAQLRTIRPVTPYPGSPLYYYAIEKGLLKGIEDFYENKHINSDLPTVNFTDMSDEEFCRCLLDANTRLLNNYFQKKISTALEQARRLYLERDAQFRGFRQT